MDPEIDKLVEDFQESDLADKNESFLESYVELAINDFVETLKENMVQIGEAWIEMGLPDQQREESHHQFAKDITDLTVAFTAKQRAKLQSLYEFRDYNLIEVNKILKDLTLADYVLDSTKPLLNQCKILKIKKNELEAVKLERLSQLDMIVQKWKKIRAHLGEEWTELKFETNIPAEFELTMARSNMINQEETYKKRKANFLELRKQIIENAKEVEFDLDEFTFMKNEDAIYSTELLKQVEDLKSQIEAIRKNIIKEKQIKLEKLAKLFERIKVESAVQVKILNAHHTSLVQQAKYFDSEIEKYELIKLGMIKDITMDVRQKVADLLSECRSEQFHLPSFFHSQDDFTEPKLEQHEKFLEHLRVYADTFKPIFSQILNYEDIMNKLMELEVKVHDPNKYKNRGGSMLTNERDHRVLSKRLENLEREIISLTLKSESISFSQYGFEIHQYFADKHQEYDDAVENVKASYGIKSKTNSRERIQLPTSSKKTAPLPAVPRSAFKSKPLTNNAAVRVPKPATEKKLTDAELAFNRNLMNRDSDFFQSTVVMESPLLSSNHKLPNRLAAPVNVFEAPSITKRRRVSRSVERTTPKRTKRHLFNDDIGTPHRF